ncbi:MAG: PAS domain-containing protein [Lysobacter sp.]|nr:PAS domain-containing protein [Lysobacter sp.]
MTAVRVVGLGASAGGLTVLGEFLAGVPAGSGMAFVVVQHLDPTHKAMLVELLQRSTPMPVRQAAEGMRLEADAVYVIPPNSDLTLAAGILHLEPPAEPRGHRLPINRLFSSLARELSERATGVVLSGMGSDGTLGLQAIKSQGGLTLAQEPESAQFDSMPRSAIDAGCVDIVALPSAMAVEILRVATGQGFSPPLAGSAVDERASLEAVVALLHEHHRHDLSDYKASTLRRRIQRRMDVHGIATTAAYAAFAKQNPHELDMLFKEVLIGVTSFFRDPAVWQELKDEVMPVLISRAAEGAKLRAWVVGCSTGEEAYSVAMIFREVADAMTGVPRTMQVFASDLSADAIAAARRGCYPRSIAADVGEERLARFFVPQGEGYLVDKGVREMVLFAQHDVILDPPFTRLDFLSCRNLLIYFDAKLQHRLLPLFSFSLRPGGVLLLGTSESLGIVQAQYTPISPKSRLYWRSENALPHTMVDFPIGFPRSRGRADQETNVPPQPGNPPANLQSLAEQALLKDHAPPAVLVNAEGDVVYIHGSVGRFLEPASGKANWNIHVMAKPSIRAQVVVGLREAIQAKAPVALRGLRLEGEAPGTVDVTIQPLAEPKALAGLVMIVFSPGLDDPPRRRRGKPGEAGADPRMADELDRWKAEVRALRQEMGASAEELQAANEELQSTNEELQAANEELTSSKEESQSMNEELQSLNSELRSKLDALELAQSDMQNLLNSTEIATLFLDSDLNVRRYTDQIKRIVNLREADIGRPLTDLSTTLVYPGLYDDAKETLRTLSFIEKQVATTDGLWFLVRIKPYRTLANVIQGVVITLIDITASKELESRLRAKQ